MLPHLQSLIEIRKLSTGDYEVLRDFFSKAILDGINKTFHPHPFNNEIAYKITSSTTIDWYAGAFECDRELQQMVGYVMLRGWDEGYKIPSFGVCVLPEYQNMGLGHLLLDTAIIVARLRASSAIRLKVYPDNLGAISLYEKAGFKFEQALDQGQLLGFLKL